MVSKSLTFLKLLFGGTPVFLLILFLWVQWPLRLFTVGNPRLVNDMGQLAFACFWVIAFGMACLTKSHLQISNTSQPRNALRLAWLRFIVCAPWAFFLLYSAMPLLMNSWHEDEKFPDSYSPGFYLIKLALVWLALAWLLTNIFSLYKAYSDKS